MDKLFREQPLGTYHELTEEEKLRVKEVKALENTIARLWAELKEATKQKEQLHNCHATGHIVYDEAGFPYDVRTCVICGKTSLI